MILANDEWFRPESGWAASRDSCMGHMARDVEDGRALHSEVIGRLRTQCFFGHDGIRIRIRVAGIERDDRP